MLTHHRTTIKLLILIVALTACASHPILEPARRVPTSEASTTSPAVPALSDAVRAAPHAACTTTEYEGRMFSIFWSSNSSVLAVRSQAGLCLYDVMANQAILSIDSRDIESGAVSPDGQLLAVGFFNGPPQLWDIVAGRRLYTFETRMKEGRAITFSPDGRWLAYGEQDNTSGPDCRVEIWDVTQKHALYTLSEAGCVEGLGKNLDFAPDGKTLALGSSYYPNLVQLWDITTGRLIRNLALEGTITDVSFAADGQTLAARSFWYTKYESRTFIKLWDLATGQELRSLQTDASSRLWPLSRDQRVILSQGDTVKLVNLKAPYEMRLLSYKAGSAAAFTPDGRILALTTDEAITLWDVKADQPLRTFASNLAPGYSIFSPDGRLLAVKSSDIMTVKVWDVETGREVFVLER